MIVPYRQLPGSAVSRPFLDVLIGPSHFRATALVDSGAVNGLFHPEVAEMGGIDLAHAEERELGVGPGKAPVPALFVTVQMEAADHTWEAEIGFTTSIGLDWGLLGQSALFRWFTISFRTYDDEYEIVPIDE